METKNEVQRIADSQQVALTALKKAGGVEHLLISLPHMRINGQNPILTIGGNPDGSVDYKRLAVLLFQIKSLLSSNPAFAKTYEALNRQQVAGQDAVLDVKQARESFIQKASAQGASYLVASLTPFNDQEDKDAIHYQGDFSLKVAEPKAVKKAFMSMVSLGLAKAVKKDPELADPARKEEA